MFGFVGADAAALSPEQKTRYGQVYCGICRQIRLQSGRNARLALSYDMAFLGLLLMSLYEPEEQSGKRACGFHPCKPRPWTDNEFVQYAAHMNVALAYYNCLDDWQDDHKLTSGSAALLLRRSYRKTKKLYPDKCAAIEECIKNLSALEKENCENPDLPAGCFGKLMGELFAYKEDLWSEPLRQMGDALGRFIYLADAALDYRQDLKKKNYNPFIAMGKQQDWAAFDQYLTAIMGRCTAHYEHLPLVQDKAILDNILYSGIWIKYRKKQKEECDRD